MGNDKYPQFVFSPISIDDLVNKLVEELEKRSSFATSPPPEQPPPLRTRLYGDKAAAAHIGCTPQVIGKLRKEGKIRYYSLGTRYYYYANELDQDLSGGKHRFGELRGRRKK